MLKKVLTALVACAVALAVGFITNVVMDIYAPTPRGAALIRICQSNSAWVLWFNSNNKPVLEQLDANNMEQLAARARRLPDSSKITLDVPCPRPTVY